jgi:hypothetical protein
VVVRDGVEEPVSFLRPSFDPSSDR